MEGLLPRCILFLHQELMEYPMNTNGSYYSTSCRSLQKLTASAGRVVASFYLVCIMALPAFGQSADEAVSFGEIRVAVNPFADAEQAMLYDEVLEKLRMVNRQQSSRHDNSSRDDDDWFVTGATRTNPVNGYIEANFNTFRGVEEVARRIVEYKFRNHNGMLPAWRVYARTGDEELARETAAKQAEHFQRWLDSHAEQQPDNQQPVYQQPVYQLQQTSPVNLPRSGGC
jgi:hypothetical protein